MGQVEIRKIAKACRKALAMNLLKRRFADAQAGTQEDGHLAFRPFYCPN